MPNNLGHREFYDFKVERGHDKLSEKEEINDKEKNHDVLVKYVDDNIIGSNTIFESPFGNRKGNNLPVLFVLQFIFLNKYLY